MIGFLYFCHFLLYNIQNKFKGQGERKMQENNNQEQEVDLNQLMKITWQQ